MQQHPPSIKQMKTKSLGEKQNRCVLVGYWLKHHKNKQTVLQHWGKTERVLIILSKTTKFQNWGLRRISIDIIQNIFSNTLVEKYIFHISFGADFFIYLVKIFPQILSHKSLCGILVNLPRCSACNYYHSGAIMIIIMIKNNDNGWLW